MRPEWIYSQEFYLPPRAGGEVWIKQTNKQIDYVYGKNGTPGNGGGSPRVLPRMLTAG